MAETGKLPNRTALQEAALSHLARYPTTEAGLERVLLRRIARAARRSEGDPEAIAAAVAAAKVAVRDVIERLRASGLLDDATFATARARRLARGGKSYRAITAHLAARGVRREVLATVVPSDSATEVLAGLVFARRRRIGPFRRTLLVDAETHQRELAAFARAGFPASVARDVLRLSRLEADERLRVEHRLIP